MRQFGILLVEHGVDRFSGERVRGRADVLKLIKKRPVWERRTTAMAVYVESVVRPERGWYRHNETPPDWKFFTFGETIGTVASIEGRKTADGCMAWLDEAFGRTDYYGCICTPIKGRDTDCRYRHCNTDRPRRPAQWPALVRTARLLGRAIGIHMRVDLFAGADGVPVLNEFTPWHTNGRAHCDLRPVSVGVAVGPRSSSTANTSSGGPPLPAGALHLRNALTQQIDHVDACRLGRLWQLAGAEEGGPTARTVPEVLRNWPSLLSDDKAKCALAYAHLRPMAWRQRRADGGRR